MNQLGALRKPSYKIGKQIVFQIARSFQFSGFSEKTQKMVINHHRREISEPFYKLKWDDESWAAQPEGKGVLEY